MLLDKFPKRFSNLHFYQRVEKSVSRCGESIFGIYSLYFFFIEVFILRSFSAIILKGEYIHFIAIIMGL